MKGKRPREVRIKSGLSEQAPEFLPGEMAWGKLLLAIPVLIGITVIDYKTDRVKNRAEAEARARAYTGQLRAYAGALERICQKPVKECLLYFLRAGETVPVAF